MKKTPDKERIEPTTNSSRVIKAPEPVQEDVKEGYRTPEQLVFREEFNKAQKWIDERISNSNYVMGVIIVVLAVGFITLLVAVVAIIIQVWGFNSNIQREMIQSIDKQTEIIREFNKGVDKLNNINKINSVNREINK